MDLSNCENGGVHEVKVVVSKEVKLVRIIWVDASGQHRCRVRFYFILFFKYIVSIDFNFIFLFVVD